MMALGFGMGITTFGLSWRFKAPVITAWSTPGAALLATSLDGVTMPGIAVLRAAGYQTPISPLISWTGFTTFLIAPFGGFAINLATITAAICTGPEAHKDPERRYLAGLALITTIANSLQSAVAEPSSREAAVITFLVTASGLTLFGIGAAFWGMIAGITSMLILKSNR